MFFNEIPRCGLIADVSKFLKNRRNIRMDFIKMEMMLQTQNLCKYFRKQKAVNNVSLNIEKEQIYGGQSALYISTDI